MTKPRLIADSANDNSIDGSRLEDGTVSSDKLGSGIDGAKLEDGTVSSDKLGSDIDGAKIQVGSIPIDRLESSIPVTAEDISYTHTGTTVEQTLQQKLEQSIVFLKDFGPAADGVTRDSDVIQAAIDATPIGGTLMFEGGKRYAIDIPIRIQKSINIDFNGATILMRITGRTPPFSVRYIDIRPELGATYDFTEIETDTSTSLATTIGNITLPAEVTDTTVITLSDTSLLPIPTGSNPYGQNQSQRFVTIGGVFGYLKRYNDGSYTFGRWRAASAPTVIPSGSSVYESEFKPIAGRVNTFDVPPDAIDVVPGDWVRVRLGQDSEDYNNEEDYYIPARVIETTPTTVSLDWATPTDINYVGSKESITQGRRMAGNSLTKITSPANNISITNLVAEVGNKLCIAAILTDTATNVVVDRLLAVPSTIGLRHGTLTFVPPGAPLGSPVGWKFVGSRNVVYKNSYVVGTRAADGWHNFGVTLDNVVNFAMANGDSGGLGFLGTEAKFKSVRMTNVQYIVVPFYLYGKTTTFITINGNSGGIDVNQATLYGSVSSFIGSNYGDLRGRITISNLDVYSGSQLLTGLGKGTYESFRLYKSETNVWEYREDRTYLAQKEYTLTPSSGLGPTVWGYGIVSQIWVWCDDWNGVDSIFIRDTVTGGGYNINLFTPVDSTWILLPEPSFIGSGGLNGGNISKDLVVSTNSSLTPGTKLKIRWRAFDLNLQGYPD